MNVATVLYWVGGGFAWLQLPLLAIVSALLYAGAVDTVQKYDERVQAILGQQSTSPDRDEFPNLDL